MLLALVTWSLVGLLIFLSYLGLVVLQASAGRFASRFLGAFLVLKGMSLLGLVLAIELWRVGFVSTPAPLLFAAICLSFLPPVLLAFVFTYPLPVKPIAAHPWLLWIPFLPSIAATLPAIILAFVRYRPGAYWDLDIALVSLIPFGVGYFLFAALCALVVLTVRWLRSKEVIESRRLRWMALGFGLPLILSLLMAGFLLFILYDDWPNIYPLGWDGVSMFQSYYRAIEGTPFILLSLLLIPSFGVSYALLRYQIIDFSLRVRLGMSRGFSGAILLAGLFAIGESTIIFFESRTGKAIFGVVAAAIVILALAPVHQTAEKLLAGATRGSDARMDYQRFRRMEVYRTTYSDLRVNGITGRERRALAALAKNLALAQTDVTAMEELVEDQHLADQEAI